MKKYGEDFIADFFSEIEKEINNAPFYTENRTDKFRTAVRNFMVKDKAYRNPALDRNMMITHLGVNKNRFAQMFRRCFDMTFRDFVNGLRLMESVKLLEESDLSIEKISEISGFGTIRTFQRLFMARYKTTPKEYRKSRQNTIN